MSFDTVEVNAIKVDLAIFADEKVIEVFEDLSLERGAVYSAIAIDGAEDESSQGIWMLTETILEE